MLPDLPKVRRWAAKQAAKTLRRYALEHAPLMAQIGTHHHHEGDRYSFQLHDSGRIQKQTFKTVSAKMVLKTATPQPARSEEMDQQLRQAASEIAKQQSRMLFTTINEAVKATGNAIDARGREFDVAMFHEALRGLWIEFDENEQPILPTIVLHPDTLKAIAPRVKAWEADPAVQTEFAEIIRLKRLEWRARESNRALVG